MGSFGDDCNAEAVPKLFYPGLREVSEKMKAPGPETAKAAFNWFVIILWRRSS